MGFDIGQLFNPLALLGAAQQEVQQFQNMLNPTKEADQAGAADSGMQLINNRGIGDIVTQFTRSHESQSSDPWGPTTETGQQASQSMDDAPDPQLRSALEAIVGNFNELDGQYAGSMFKDGRFSRDNLVTIAQNEHDFPQSIFDAAEYLLAHPDVFDQMAELSGGDGCITPRGAQLFQNAFAGMASAPTQSTTLTELPLPSVVASTDGYPSTSSSATAASSGDVRASIAERGQVALDRLDAQIANLMNGPLDPKSLQQLQQLMEKRQEMFTMLSNIDKCFHDMSMTAINNIR